MGVSPARIFVLASALGGALAGPRRLPAGLQYDVHPAIGLFLRARSPFSSA